MIWDNRNIHLEGRRFLNDEVVELTIREWFRMLGPHLYRGEIINLVPNWDKRIIVLGDSTEKLWY